MNIDKPIVFLYGDKKDLESHLACRDGIEPYDNAGRRCICLPMDIGQKYEVPVNCNIDTKLNKNKFILPGLGDAGDRYMGT